MVNQPNILRKGLAVAAWILLVSPATADQLHVPSQFPIIQLAIDAAADGDEIVVAPGVHPGPVDFIGKAITLRSEAGPDVTTIDGAGTFHVVQCVSGEGSNTVLDGFTITGGNATGLMDPDRTGGGMYNDSSSPTVNNCIFSANTARWGGGMFNGSLSRPTVTNCAFDGSTGSGMYNVSSSPTVINCTFSGGSAIASNRFISSNGGGGMANWSSNPTVANCTFIGNTADFGGGMYNNNSSPTVTDCTFTGNSSIHVDVVTPGGGNGGGMYNSSSSSPTVTNCTFNANTAEFNGGGMYSRFNSKPTLINCTFSGNSALKGGGIYSNWTSTCTLTNCIMWGGLPNEIDSGTDSFTVVTYSNIQGGWPGEGNINAEPLFVDALFGDYRLQPGSPCIDAANNNAVPTGFATDLNGNPRLIEDLSTVDTGAPLEACAIVDMGAYEYQDGIICCNCPGDSDNDGDVDVDDLGAVFINWGVCP